uniref:Uncharacterized protein n=1 Tax=Apteryx owenii TaxID=8824 RepID=A0A8B9SDD4_APTOW
MIPETGAALFNKPTSSSNSVANTEEGNLIDGAYLGEKKKGGRESKYSEGPDASFRCCK